jgi:autotransporter-associated beta strand protein
LSGGISGGGALVKTGAGTLTLSGPDSYSGLTTISNGTFIISTAHAENGDVMVNDTMTFGVTNILASGTSALVGNLALGNAAGPTTLRFADVADPTTPVLDASSGNVVLNGNCTIKIADAVNLTAPNEYPLLKYSNIVTNSGTGFSLALPPGVTASLTNDNSAIALVVTHVSALPSAISSIVVSGNNLVINATGGTPGASVNILTTTNLALPLIQWTTNSTTSFDGSGNLVNYTITGAVNSGLPQQFYRLQQ